MIFFSLRKFRSRFTSGKIANTEKQKCIPFKEADCTVEMATGVVRFL